MEAFKETKTDVAVKNGTEKSRRPTTRNKLGVSHSATEIGEFRDHFADGSNPTGAINHVTTRDLENLKWDIVNAIKEELRNSHRESPDPPRASHSDETMFARESPGPPTPPARPNYFRPVDGNLDVDIHGIRQRASTMGIRYHLSPTMRDSSGGVPEGRPSLTRL